MPRAPHPRVAMLAVVALVVLVADQLTKVWALARLTEGERTPLIGDLLGLQLIFNPGAALSFASGMTWIFTVAAVGVTVVIVRVSRRLGSAAWAVGLGLLLGGALGNLVDRLFRPPGFAVGHVVDFIAYGQVFIGNVADIAIVAAAVLIVLLSLRGITVEGLRVSDAPEGEPVDGPADGAADAAEESGAGDSTSGPVAPAVEPPDGSGSAAGARPSTTEGR
ncbi:signal peptidase II [Actinotalea sp.]|uniref:signal peptidase II n=1 Tax=Actinotalea sp. TaxID=1872145 RepID=UPI003569BFD2